VSDLFRIHRNTRDFSTIVSGNKKMVCPDTIIEFPIPAQAEYPAKGRGCVGILLYRE
jgi:hypothetical protein